MMKFWGKKQQKKPVTQSRFKQDFSLAQRRQRRAAFKHKYPDSDFCVAVIEGLRQLPSSNKNIKPYQLIGLEKTLTGLHIIRYLKKSMHINESVSLIVVVSSSVVNMSTTVGQLGQRFTDSDGFLYIYVKVEDSF